MKSKGKWKNKLCAQVSVNKWKSIYHAIKCAVVCVRARSSTCSCTTYLFILHVHTHALRRQIQFSMRRMWTFMAVTSPIKHQSNVYCFKHCYIFVQFRIGIVIIIFNIRMIIFSCNINLMCFFHPFCRWLLFSDSAQCVLFSSVPHRSHITEYKSISIHSVVFSLGVYRWVCALL